MPVLTPFELWQRTGRDFIPELFRLKDRKGGEYVLPMTHEETVTFHARELQSYRQLPQMLYHFSIKERDEPRPGKGLIRLREFIMKDSYSFDRDEARARAQLRAPARPPTTGSSSAAASRCSAVEAESGMMGGSESVDFLAPAGAGENTLVTCENGDFAADLEVARAVPRAPELPERLAAPEEVETPGIDDVRGARGLPRDRRGRDLEGDAGRRRTTAASCSRSCAATTGSSRAKLAGRARRPARGRRPTRRSARAFGAAGGSLGPVGFDGEIVADEALREGQFVAGANRDGFHLRGVEAGRDFEPRFADLRESREGDTLPARAAARSASRRAIEVGHIFKLGTRYSEPLGATFLDEDGNEKPLVMGSYGIGPGRG